MERRTFMALVSGGLLAVPLAAEAQQVEKRYRIGYLIAYRYNPERMFSRVLVSTMRDLGYSEGSPDL